jgi:hypothetical protein
VQQEPLTEIAAKIDLDQTFEGFDSSCYSTSTSASPLSLLGGSRGRAWVYRKEAPERRLTRTVVILIKPLDLFLQD